MTDNYYLDDLIASLEKDVVMERYYPLINDRESLISIMKTAGVIRKEEVSDEVMNGVRVMLGEDKSKLFSRFLHIYDFNKSKLREIKDYAGTEKYDVLAGLLRLPGVRLLRAELYCNSGVTLEALAERSTEEIRDAVRDYIRRENRPEIVPLPKEVNCHRAVAKMILRANE